LEDTFRAKKPYQGSQMKQSKITQFVNRSRIKDSCLNIITNCAAPFTLFDNPGMQSLIQLASNFIKETVTINSSNLKSFLMEEAKELKIKIKKMLEGKLINLQVDFATCQGHSYMGKLFIIFHSYKKRIFRPSQEQKHTKAVFENLGPLSRVLLVDM
jgi:hypothetical protein